MDFTRTYDATGQTIVNTYDVDGQMSLFDILNDGALAGIMYPTLTDAAQATPETNVFKGGVLVPGGSVITGEVNTTYAPAVTVSGKSISVEIDRYLPLTSMTLEGKAPTQVYVAKDLGTGVMKINDQNITLSLKGVAVGVALDDAGAVSYSLLARPGYTLSKEMTCSGFTIDDCNEKTAKITLSDTAISCTANPIKYKINLDGKTVKENVEYGTSVTGVTVESGVLMVVDSNGKAVGQVSGTNWFPGVYYYTKDLDAKTVTGKTLAPADVKKDQINKITDASSVRFTVPAGGSSLQFALSSKVRFDLKGLTADDDIELVAQTTNYNGHDAFIIKASNGSSAQEATLYIPVSNTNSKLMHVDEYGRVSERQADVVTIDGDNFLKTTTSDYSIFYAETDSSPVLDNGGNGPNFLLIAIGVVVAVALVAGVVVFIKKH